ncbi:Translin [Eumeta japonica]|uniref:Translin n=1 Tax=Eumeta variegata TaxID=151549 RepID=A0A4C1VF91_EUMVA|nr:Translin [Eumeta japonica]
MSDNRVITSIFEEFQKNLDQEQELRETIRSTCKEIDQLSREVLTVLQVIHNNEPAIPQACQKARDIFEKVRDGYSKLKEAVPDHEYYKYQDHWRFMTQRLCFLISLTIWLEKGILVTHETVAEVLGVSAVEQRLGFHLDIEDYLVGLLQMCSEVSRLAVNSVTRGDYSTPQQISKFVMELNAGFRLLNLKNDHLRKRFDALKYDVKKIEEVVYDLSIRGLLPASGNADAASMSTE